MKERTYYGIKAAITAQILLLQMEEKSVASELLIGWTVAGNAYLQYG